MREQWAQRVALLTGVLLVAIATALSSWHNRFPAEPADDANSAPRSSGEASAPALPTESASARAVRGRAIYDAQGCARCHSIAGVGNPRNPLDGVGVRRDAAQLRQWITADRAITEALSTRTRAAKAEYAALPPAELDALVAYLRSL